MENDERYNILPLDAILEFQSLMKSVYNREIDLETARKESHEFMELFMVSLDAKKFEKCIH